MRARAIRALLLVASCCASGCSRHVYCWRNTETSAPHCFSDEDHCRVDLLSRPFAAIEAQIRAGEPEPTCVEEAR